MLRDVDVQTDTTNYYLVSIIDTPYVYHTSIIAQHPDTVLLYEQLVDWFSGTNELAIKISYTAPVRGVMGSLSVSNSLFAIL